MRTIIRALLAASAARSSGHDSAGAKRQTGRPQPSRTESQHALEQLEDLPGIGRATAQRILESPEERFKKIEELMNVKGIGEELSQVEAAREHSHEDSSPGGDSLARARAACSRCMPFFITISARGAALVDLVFTCGIVAVIAGITIPTIHAARDRDTTRWPPAFWQIDCTARREASNATRASAIRFDPVDVGRLLFTSTGMGTASCNLTSRVASTSRWGPRAGSATFLRPRRSAFCATSPIPTAAVP